MTDTINYVRLDAENLAELREAAKQALQLLGSHPAPNGGAVYEALNHGLSVTSGAFVDELVDDEDTRPTQPSRDELAQRLRDIAEGARSKASLIASKSPTAAYTNPVDVLRALAKEAEGGLAPDPDAGLEIQRTLLLSTAHLPVAHRRWLDGQTRATMAAPHHRPAPTLIVDAIGEYGWRICLEFTAVEQYLDKHERDDALAVLLRLGQHHRCQWLALDRDGETVDGLPTFED
jgi:hypothetical protein